MADTPFATVQDVQDRWPGRTLTADEEKVVEVLIDDASDMIRVRWSTVDDRITSGELRDLTLTRIVAGMVRRAMIGSSNEGWETRTETVGPFSVGGQLSNPNANLYLTADDVRLLDGNQSGGNKAFAVDLATAPVRALDAAW